MPNNNTLLLGEIKGKLEALASTVDSMDGKLDSIDSRVRTLETRAAGAGAIAGTIVSVGIAVIIEKLKSLGT